MPYRSYYWRLCLCSILTLTGCSLTSFDGPYANEEQPHKLFSKLSSQRSCICGQAEASCPKNRLGSVRLIWLPNQTDDKRCAPGKYSYLRVFRGWSIQGAFELEERLNSETSLENPPTPWIYEK